MKATIPKAAAPNWPAMLYPNIAAISTGNKFLNISHHLIMALKFSRGVMLYRFSTIYEADRLWIRGICIGAR